MGKKGFNLTVHIIPKDSDNTEFLIDYVKSLIKQAIINDNCDEIETYQIKKAEA